MLYSRSVFFSLLTHTHEGSFPCVFGGFWLNLPCENSGGLNVSCFSAERIWVCICWGPGGIASLGMFQPLLWVLAWSGSIRFRSFTWPRTTFQISYQHWLQENPLTLLLHLCLLTGTMQDSAHHFSFFPSWFLRISPKPQNALQNMFVYINLQCYLVEYLVLVHHTVKSGCYLLFSKENIFSCM